MNKFNTTANTRGITVRFLKVKDQKTFDFYYTG